MYRMFSPITPRIPVDRAETLPNVKHRWYILFEPNSDLLVEFFIFVFSSLPRNRFSPKRPPFLIKNDEKSWKNHEKSWKSSFFFVNTNVWCLFVLETCPYGSLIIFTGFYDILVILKTVFESKTTFSADFIGVARSQTQHFQPEIFIKKLKKSLYSSRVISRARISLRIVFRHSQGHIYPENERRTEITTWNGLDRAETDKWQWGAIKGSGVRKIDFSMKNRLLQYTSLGSFIGWKSR